MIYIEILGVLLGLLYIWLEYRANVWLWLAGIVMPALYIFIYYRSGFYADVGISIYYILAGLYGWISWKRRPAGKSRVLIGRTPRRYILPLIVILALVSAVLISILINFTDSTVPYGDGFTTALSVVALWMLARKYVEQWLVWVVVDAVSAGLYLYKGLYPTGGLYLLYSVIAVFGYFKWKRAIGNETT